MCVEVGMNFEYCNFLITINDLNTTKSFFLNHLQNSLFEEGTKNLSTDFRDELKNYQKAVPPYITMELVNLEENGKLFKEIFINELIFQIYMIFLMNIK